MSGFDNYFYNASIDWNVHVFNEIGNTKNFEVRFRLW